MSFIFRSSARASISALAALVIIGASAFAQDLEAQCQLPVYPVTPPPFDSPAFRELQRKESLDPLIDPHKLGEPAVLECLLKTAAQGTWRSALEWAEILMWEGTTDGSTGSLFPRSEARLKPLLEIGVSRGSHYSMLAKAAYLQDIDATTALELYLRVAKDDDCRGQFMAAWMYQKGIGVEINEATAYFWGRLGARSGTSFRRPDSTEYDSENMLYHPVPYLEQHVRAIIVGNPQVVWERRQDCSDFRQIVDLDRMATAPYADEVHDLLLKWRRGSEQPTTLDKYSGYQQGVKEQSATELAAASPAPRELTSRATWKPVTARFAPAGTRARPIADLYDELSKSVYVIIAWPSVADMRARRNQAQGSAVAIDVRTLITNCHIVEGRPAVYVSTRDGVLPLRVSAARVAADTCVLVAEHDQFAPVASIRQFSTLQIGENVIAIGAPSGFSNTLSTGIVSQLRVLDNRKLIQTNAAISGGSSGGGLFDERGNLIGITSYGVRGAEGLNFAIAIDEYVKP